MIKIFAPFFSRTLGLIFTVFLLSSCVDDGSLQLANGIGGTGISTGRITAFGSVYVNGVKFNTDQANFIRNGEGNKTQADFYTGEQVSITGRVNQDNATGVAEKVIYNYTAIGFANVSTETNTLMVGERPVVINALTVLHGFRDIADLSPNDVIELSGFSASSITAPNEITDIVASSIRRIADGEVFTLSGFASNIDTQQKLFTVNGMTVDYRRLPDLSFDTRFVKVKAQATSTDQRVMAVSVDVVASGEDVTGTISGNSSNPADGSNSNSELLDSQQGNFYQQEGVVSNYFNGNLMFEGKLVRVNEETTYVNGSVADLIPNRLLRVEGEYNDSHTVIVSSITFLDALLASKAEAIITDIDQVKGWVTILGQSYPTNYFTLFSDETNQANNQVNLSHFSVGDEVVVNLQAKSGNAAEVVRLTKVAATGVSKVLSQVTSKQSDIGQLALLNVDVTTQVTTQYYDANNQSITQAEFFNQVIVGVTSVEATGVVVSNEGNALLATLLKLTHN